jgi:O-antigen ligase
MFGLLIFKKSFENHILQSSRLSLLFISANALLVCLSFISISYAHLSSESIYVTAKYGILFVFLVTTYFLLSIKLLFRRDIINCVFIFCVISLCYGAYDIVMLWINNLNILRHSLLITATYANKNLFASLLMLCIWAVLMVRIPYVIKLALIVFLFALVLLLQSKIVVFVTVCLFLALGIKRLRSLQKQKKTVFVATLIILALMVFVFLNFSQFVNLSSLHTLDTRYALWTNSLQMFIEKPLGAGAGNWQIFFPKYGLFHFDLAEVRNGTAMGRQPHNDFIWMLCESGIQGFAVYLFVYPALFSSNPFFKKKQRSSSIFIIAHQYWLLPDCLF